MKLTDPTVRALKPRETRYDVYDDTLPNFGVRVGISGTLTFFVLYRARGEKVRLTLGRYPLLSLSEAREKARKAQYEAKYAPTPKHTSQGYSEAVERYLHTIEPFVRHNTHRQYARDLRRFQFRMLADITPSDISDQLSVIESISAQTAAYTSLKVFLNWCMERDMLQKHPMSRLKKPRTSLPRERTLSDDELRTIWQGLEHHSDTRYANILRLLMLTGQRANQIAALRRDRIAGSTIHFLKEDMKAGKPHTLPLGPTSQAIIDSISTTPFLFPPPGMEAPFSAWSKNKAMLDSRIAIPHWTIHDLRRTWSTNAARAGINPEITERILAHSTPGGSRIAAIYNRHKYEEETREAMNRMDAFIMGLVTISQTE